MTEEIRGGSRAASLASLAVLILLSLLTAAFFAFVGYMKAFAPLATLAEHHAWTVRIAEPLGRLVGWSEMACALALALSLLRRGLWALGAGAAAILIVNQAAAAAIHYSHSESAALPQNGVIAAICLAIVMLHRWRSRSR